MHYHGTGTPLNPDLDRTAPMPLAEHTRLGVKHL